MFELGFEPKRYKEKKKTFQAAGTACIKAFPPLPIDFQFGASRLLLAPPKFLCSIAYAHGNMDMPFPSTYPCWALCSRSSHPWVATMYLILLRDQCSSSLKVLFQYPANLLFRAFISNPTFSGSVLFWFWPFCLLYVESASSFLGQCCSWPKLCWMVSSEKADFPFFYMFSCPFF